MRIATKALLEKDLKRFIREDNEERYIVDEDMTEITELLLRCYSNIYCFSGANKFGRKVYSVSSTSTHKKLIEVFVKSFPSGK